MNPTNRPGPGAKKPSLGGAKPGLGKLGSVRPQAVAADRQELVKTSYLVEEQTLPLVIEPAKPGVDLLSWAISSRGYLEKALLKHGGILFRGFGVESPERFEAFIDGIAQEALEYRERSSPRSSVKGHIYTSTDYPPDQPIFLHNENSYAHTWPLKIFFYCHREPAVGGETPIADVREVYRDVPPEIRERLESKGILYVRNFSEHVGLTWQAVFQTDDREQVEAYARERGYELEWTDGGGLRTRRSGAASYDHPRTGERVWFNHATFFHVSTLAPMIREALLSQFGEERLPNNTYYGDGSPIEPDVLDTLRAVYDRHTVKFPWRRRDVLMLDNMLTAHGRMPFEGERKILVGMAEPIERADLA